jgi:alkanesulfonate monooxygenase SsuD/methylene tetrahydromethanopterin reductase-like flavin-dependent oxidoreductase (luciferase family)
LYIRFFLIGTPEEVAGRMGQAMQEIGDDGFLISPFQRINRNFISEVCEGLVPSAAAPWPGARDLHAIDFA